jgi:hypothetical protein
MKTITLKVEQNGGEYYGYVTVSGVPKGSNIIKSSKELQIDDLKISFDELIDIIEIK